MMLGSKILLQASLRRTSDLLALVSYYKRGGEIVQNKGSELPKEHILVCLSSSPSNERIVRMAGADVLGIWFTLCQAIIHLLPFYMIGYGVIRCFVEGLRTDSLYLIPGVRVSQVLSGWLPDSIGCFTCRYYLQKEGYTGMKLICSLFITFLKIGAFTFGGGYAMIALLENEFVEKKKWLEKSEFLDMVAVAESTPGPVAVNSATYIGYKIAGFAGATMSTLAVCIPSFFVIYGISLFFDQFLSLRWVSCAFRGIQVCVIYLILTAGLKMLKSIDKNTLNLTLLTLVMASMLCCSITAVSFSSVFYILICGAVGLVVFFLRKIRKGDGKKS